MSASLNNVTTGDRYQKSTELDNPTSVRVRLLVANAAIYWRVGQGSPPMFDEPEAMLLPGYYSLDCFADAVGVRSYVQGTPGQVSIQLLVASEVGQ